MDNEYGINYNGNIDLNNRPILINNDGSVSTESSIGVNDGNGTEYLIPTIIEGQRVSDEAAIDYFNSTNQHLGKIPIPRTTEEWNLWSKYAEDIHKRQSKFYTK